MIRSNVRAVKLNNQYALEAGSCFCFKEFDGSIYYLCNNEPLNDGFNGNAEPEYEHILKFDTPEEALLFYFTKDGDN